MGAAIVSPVAIRSVFSEVQTRQNKRLEPVLIPIRTDQALEVFHIAVVRAPAQTAFGRRATAAARQFSLCLLRLRRLTVAKQRKDPAPAEQQQDHKAVHKRSSYYQQQQ